MIVATARPNTALRRGSIGVSVPTSAPIAPPAAPHSPATIQSLAVPPVIAVETAFEKPEIAAETPQIMTSSLIFPFLSIRLAGLLLQ